MVVIRAYKTEEVGFEPTEPFWSSPVFKTGPFNRSGTPPRLPHHRIRCPRRGQKWRFPNGIGLSCANRRLVVVRSVCYARLQQAEQNCTSNWHAGWRAVCNNLQRRRIGPGGHGNLLGRLQKVGQHVQRRGQVAGV
jgi:hypothetical protein